MRVRTLTSPIAAIVILLAGCATVDSSEHGECTIKVRYDDHVYRALRVESKPRSGKLLGRAHFADCAGNPMPRREKKQLFALPGTGTGKALLLGKGEHRSVYVNQALSHREWPAVLKAATGYQDCQHPVRFTGTWDSLGLDDTRRGRGYHIAVPYTGILTATHGKGLRMDRWVSVMLRARITKHTDPLPSRRLLEHVLGGKRPVTVTAKCRGKRFEVATIRAAR
ncbi:MAG: hypothetical protein ACRDQA_17150 [Nocardioidaceae bacterium]